MVVLGRGGCIRAKCCILSKVVVIGQIGCIRTKVVVFGQKWFYSVKVVVSGQKWLYLGKSG